MAQSNKKGALTARHQRKCSPAMSSRLSCSAASVRRAFTLIEIMIVVTIIGVLLAIAVPNFVNMRERSRQKACIANLRQIDAAKEQYALDFGKRDGDYLTLTSLIGTYLKGPSFSSSTAASVALEFKCPSSDLPYGPTMGNLGTPPICPTASARTGPYAHALP